MSAALSSWKEIAAYLGKGVRTVQRWEQQFALPVRRPNAKSHVIFAIPEELDAWVKKQQQFAGQGRTGLVNTGQFRDRQHALIRILEDRIRRLQANRRTLDTKLTQLSTLIKVIAQKNGRGKDTTNQQRTSIRGAA